MVDKDIEPTQASNKKKPKQKEDKSDEVVEVNMDAEPTQAPKKKKPKNKKGKSDEVEVEAEVEAVAELEVEGKISKKKTKRNQNSSDDDDGSADKEAAKKAAKHARKAERKAQKEGGAAFQAAPLIVGHKPKTPFDAALYLDDPIFSDVMKQARSEGYGEGVKDTVEGVERTSLEATTKLKNKVSELKAALAVVESKNQVMLGQLTTAVSHLKNNMDSAEREEARVIAVAAKVAAALSKKSDAGSGSKSDDGSGSKSPSS